MPATVSLPVGPAFPAELLPTLLEVSLAAVLLLQPVYAPDGGKLTDFTVAYLSPAAQRILGRPEQPGGTMLAHFPHLPTSGLLDFYRQVFETNAADRHEVHYQGDGFDSYCYVAAQRQGPWLVVSFTDTAEQPRSALEAVVRDSQARERAAWAEAEGQRQRVQLLNQELATAVEQLRLSNTELEHKVANRTHALLVTLQQLEQQRGELAQALAAEQKQGELKSRFVSMASHEFRTPLTAVLTSADLIADYPTADQQPKRLRHVTRIRTAVAHLRDLLEEFLSADRLAEGKLVAHPANLEPAALLAETVAAVQGLRKAGQTIVHRACACPIRLDTSLLRKILLNLLSNALKYSGENSVVTVEIECRNKNLLIKVQDQGIGISAADQAHLFERFFRAHNATEQPGTGLGLHIIAQYLALMQGRIALASELGVGTTFTVTIPYADYSAD